MQCYIVEKEFINLKTGQTRWSPFNDPPENSCPSCCDPKGKLISRKTVKRPCSEPFMAGNGKSYQQRTELVYADGNCKTTTEYTYSLACAVDTTPIRLVRGGVVTGLCRLKIEINSGNETSIIELSELPLNYPYAIGTYSIRATIDGCTGTPRIKALTNQNTGGTTLWTQGDQPKTLTIDSNTLGFYVELI